MKVKAWFALSVTALFQNIALAAAFSYDDCILNGLKGVSGDAAAVLVRKACESKRDAAADARERAIRDEYGDELSLQQLSMLVVESWDRASVPGSIIVRVVNHSGQTVRYVRLEAADQISDRCGVVSSHAYRLNLAPGEVGLLRIPKRVSSDQLCARISYARAREPSWQDQIRRLGSAIPVDASDRDVFSTRPNPMAPLESTRVGDENDPLGVRKLLERAAEEALRQPAPRR